MHLDSIPCLQRFTHFLLIFLSHFVLILALLIAARGSLSTFPLREDNHYFSTKPIFNHLATNPLIAFSWAYANDKTKEIIPHFDEILAQNLQNELGLKIMHKTPQNAFLERNLPHIVFVLMESFGSNLLSYDDRENFDTLGSLREHFESDFVFYRFLSGANGTVASLCRLFFNSPFGFLPISAHKNTPLQYNPFRIYKNAGYEVIYITSGYASWHSLGAYITTQGADRIYDAFSIMEHFPQSAADRNAYGVSDEWAYKLALKMLLNAEKPTFIAMLTTSNHPPYHLPKSHKAKPLNPSAELLARNTHSDKGRFLLSLSLYQYASNAFGEFMSAVKNASFKDKIIIGASGDHHYRDIAKSPSPSALDYAVPFYLYVPEPYRREISYNPFALGSHKDIFPTLYELSLSNAEYMSAGGRNLLKNSRNAFGFNENMWIDERGMFLRSEGYAWADSCIESAKTPCENLKDSITKPPAEMLKALRAGEILKSNEAFYKAYKDLFAQGFVYDLEN